MSEAEIQKAVAFLAETERVFNRYKALHMPSGIQIVPRPNPNEEVKPLPKDVQDRIAARQKAEGEFRGHLTYLGLELSMVSQDNPG